MCAGAQSMQEADVEVEDTPRVGDLLWWAGCIGLSSYPEGTCPIPPLALSSEYRNYGPPWSAFYLLHTHSHIHINPTDIWTYVLGLYVKVRVDEALSQLQIPLRIAAYAAVKI